MSFVLRFGGLAACVFLLLGNAWAEPGCRLAFDVGSSGIRAGVVGAPPSGRVDIDYLAPLWAGRGLDETLPATVEALRDLSGPQAAACSAVAGGFSAWRLALQNRHDDTLALLARLYRQSGVALLIVPQAVEGRYGAYGARQQLGSALQTSHILDIGGGSLQIAGERASYGEALGQKVWHRLLCQVLQNREEAACELQPMTPAMLLLARKFAIERLQGIRRALPGPVTMTAISRPVTRGVQPAVAHRLGLAPAEAIPLTALSGLIERLAGLNSEATAAVTGTAPAHAAWLFSDMLLVEALLKTTGGQALPVADVDLTNVPGLLDDARAFAWAAHYDCYLERLGRLGEAAYHTDPASCPH